MMTKAEIILVEDDPDDVYLFMSACEHLEPQPHVAVLGNGAELVQLVEQEDCRDKVILIESKYAAYGWFRDDGKVKCFS
ncbi:hypothetical protein [Pseudoalteromonas xiamenensis]